MARYIPRGHNGVRHHRPREPTGDEQRPPFQELLPQAHTRGGGPMDDSAYVYQLMLIVVMSVIFAAVWLCSSKRRRRSDLNAPLLSGESVEHRIDAATRDAENGFLVCPTCAFENFERLHYCTLCGDALPRETEEPEVLSRRSRLLEFLKRKTCHHLRCIKATTTSEESESGQEFVAKERMRSCCGLNFLVRASRRRKEWTRRLDLHGRMFWYRASVDNGVESLSPAVVVRFTRPSDAAPNLASANNVERVQVMSLSDEVKATTMELQPVASVNAAASPLGHALEAIERMREVQDAASKDFPTRLAHFVVTTASALVPAEVEFLKLSVHRDFMFEESVEHISCIQEKNIRSIMRINFLEESGVDAGGVHREWFLLMNETLLDPVIGLFQCTNRVDQTYYLNASPQLSSIDDELSYFFAAGRLVGRALLEGAVWGFHFATPLLKIILGIPVTFEDLESLDPEVYRSMLWIKHNSNVDVLGLAFIVTEQRGDEMVTIELIPDGENIAVTDENKLQYLERKFQYMVFERVSDQLYVFLKGIYEVMPPHLLMLFDHEEFNYLMCGTQEIDVDDWQQHSINSLNLNGTRVLRWFWEVVHEMPNEYKRRLLQFATGSSRVPLAGFKGLTSYDGRLCPFTIKGISYNTSQYIRSHACFNRIDLPLYRTKKEFKTVLYATLDTDLTGFTTD
ncbi:TPA: LOW QUALITY PROTEIN: hypothetical protein N0F65_008669 [Lagenidium giganteum]|uniref:HECT-type E3 ubiquitin transferase n=1 Tax=Lagenidium giganteum TaxID=4803 RepID=A0AAV2Z9F2_9STRA|nr:TPA: LOW QUALITY PROTEIN: hypothetical protein N0F65_008669 [Lagenidium giganteum]